MQTNSEIVRQKKAHSLSASIAVRCVAAFGFWSIINGLSNSLLILSADAAGLDTQRINGYDAQALLGNGTGVIVGIVDSGIDKNHPALSGSVTGGLPRLVVEANFVPTEPANTGDDVYGHGTAVAGQILSRDATFGGVATDSRYVNARVLDSNNSFASDAWVINGTGFALANGANLLNLSLGYFNGNTSGSSTLSLMTDYISYTLRVPITISAGNAGAAPITYLKALEMLTTYLVWLPHPDRRTGARLFPVALTVPQVIRATSRIFPHRVMQSLPHRSTALDSRLGVGQALPLPIPPAFWPLQSVLDNRMAFPPTH